jgi:hypothetical protein
MSFGKMSFGKVSFGKVSGHRYKHHVVHIYYCLPWLFIGGSLTSNVVPSFVVKLKRQCPSWHSHALNELQLCGNDAKFQGEYISSRLLSLNIDWMLMVTRGEREKS